tara:strand:+ start:488 stop:1033 length:546 start_codon:yes stop_codon:yes gene_type:complete
VTSPNNIQIIDNFLPEEQFYNFTEAVTTAQQFGNCDATAYAEESSNLNFAEQMSQAIMFRRMVNGAEVSDCYIHLQAQIQDILKLLKVKRLWLMRLNCTFGQKERYQGTFHIDNLWSDYLKKYGKISILYLNTNNGGTQFKDGPFVESVANRCVIAPMLAEHAGVWATDTKLRYVLNFNYE